jgi:hypothetical protein
MPSPSSSLALTCVLIDFSLTSQGDPHQKIDDYAEVADLMDEAGILRSLIRKWFGPREEWDP